jgi:hypothetical protein
LPANNDHDTTASPGDTWLSNQDLADRWDVPIKTIRSWRLSGYGPPGARFGNHVRYSLAEVRHWERERAQEQRHSRDDTGAGLDDVDPGSRHQPGSSLQRRTGRQRHPSDGRQLAQRGRGAA